MTQAPQNGPRTTKTTEQLLTEACTALHQIMHADTWRTGMFLQEGPARRLDRVRQYAGGILKDIERKGGPKSPH